MPLHAPTSRPARPDAAGQAKKERNSSYVPSIRWTFTSRRYRQIREWGSLQRRTAGAKRSGERPSAPAVQPIGQKATLPQKKAGAARRETVELGTERAAGPSGYACAR